MASKKKSSNTTEQKSNETGSRGTTSGEDLNTDAGNVDRGANTDRSRSSDRNINRDVNEEQDQSLSEDRSDETDTDTDLNR